MTPTAIVGAVVLVCTLGVGTVAHELSHALALEIYGISYEIEWLPDRSETGPLRRYYSGPLATVTPLDLQGMTVSTPLRVAAMMPFALVLPLAPVGAGILPDPFQVGTLPSQLALIGWLACALPSPRDFSLFWYADRIVEGRIPDKATSS